METDDTGAAWGAYHFCIRCRPPSCPAIPSQSSANSVRLLEKAKGAEWATRGGGADYAIGMIRALNREFMDNAVAKDISRDTRLPGRCPHSRRIRRALCPPARRKPIVQGRGDKHHGIRCERRLWNAQAPKRVQCAFAAATHASSGSISDVSNLPGGAKTTAILTCLLAGRRMTRL